MELNQLAGQVRTYIEKVLPQLERPGGFPDSPMDRKMKGKSNPVVGDRAMLLWFENLEASSILNPRLEEVRTGRNEYNGIEYRDMLLFSVYDSGGFGRWLSAQEKPYGLSRREKLQTMRSKAFWVMCLHIAQVCRIKHGKNLSLSVKTSPDMVKYDEVADPRRVAPRWRTIGANDAYRTIVARLERIRMENPGMEEKDVEKLCSKELEELGHSGSIGRIRDAKTYVNAERGGDAA